MNKKKKADPGKRLVDTTKRNEQERIQRDNEMAAKNKAFLKKVIDDLEKWMNDDSRVKQIERMYDTSVVDHGHVFAEVYMYLPDPGVLSENDSGIDRQNSIPTPFVKVLASAEPKHEHEKQVKPGSIWTMADGNSGWTLDSRWAEAMMLKRSRMVGSDTGKATVKNMPTFSHSPMFAMWDNRAFSVSKFGREPGDISTFLLAKAELHLPINKKEHIKHYRSLIG